MRRRLLGAFGKGNGRGTLGGCARALLIGMTTALAGVGAGLAPSPALADVPQWKIVSIASPTNLQPGSPRDEVQQVTVNASGGTFALIAESSNCSEGGQTTASIPYNASAAEVQSALEAISCVFPSGTVAVTGGPGGESPVPYVITFGAVLANQPVPVMQANGSSLTGPKAKATVAELTKGKYMTEMRVVATNVGGAGTDGSTITLNDVLPAGLVVKSVIGYDTYASGSAFGGVGAAAMSCAAPPSIVCTYSGAVTTGDTLVMTLELEVESGAVTGIDQASVSGGGGASASSSNTLTVSDTPASPGPAPGSVMAALSTNQAGAHSSFTTALALNTIGPGIVAASPKDIRFNLPPGLVGNTVGMPRCTMKKVLGGLFEANSCPSDSMVGMATITIKVSGAGGTTVVVPVYNIEPSPGEPVAFAFDAVLFPVRLDTKVLSDGNYGVRVTAPSLSEAANVLSSWVTIWGVPADHNGPGEDKTFFNIFYGGSFGGPKEGQTRVPLLTNPQQCSTPLLATMETDAWETQGTFVSSPPLSMDTLTGCDQLSLESSFSMLPDTLEAGAPAGYSFDLKVPQHNEPDRLAAPNVKDVSLTLPLGTVVNPSAAWGLKACSDAQFGLHTGLPAECPREAQVGTVRIKTPALEEALTGQVYLGAPECEPCSPQDAEDGKMVRLFVNIVGEGESGIVVKLEGRAHIDQGTGRITTVFKDNPQLPFDEFKLTLGGGPRAVLANPRTCGAVTTTMDLVPWSSPFTPDSTPSYTFDISQNCFAAQFNPSFSAGMTNIQAGEYGPFTLAFGRADNDQYLSGLSMSLPSGLLGKLAGIELCKEAQASVGTCGAGSLIGHVQALTGPGADPFLVSGGQVFLTEGYKGAPYGLSIVVPAVAGPYTLSGTTGQGTVVVRAKIVVDPITAELTVTSDPLPTMLDGIPLQLKAVNVTIDRPSFTFNPTSCAPTAINGSIASSEGLAAKVSTRFQVTNCAGLSFKPGFKVSTTGKTSRKNGAGLDVKLTYPTGSLGKAANIKSVKVDLPKQLPSRLTTLQKACPDSVFDQNPAACPPASRVGSATASTPIIPESLAGPAYFVSHGGAKFPELVIVLSGYGVTVQLHGETFINKAGITSSTFRSVPDVPIGSFELKLPQGANSALAANGNLCAASLKMPTAFTAQNGMVIHQSTSVTATGCPRHKAAKHKAAKHKKSRKGRK
jgi:hypothetical protein